MIEGTEVDRLQSLGVYVWSHMLFSERKSSSTFAVNSNFSPIANLGLTHPTPEVRSCTPNPKWPRILSGPDPKWAGILSGPTPIVLPRLKGNPY